MKVKCINRSRSIYLQEGKTYNVLDKQEDLGMLLVQITKDKNMWFTMSRFIEIN